jgi:uncharacterized protein (TIGR01777 family)
MKIVLAGATGLIGSALIKRLTGKHDLVIFTRRADEVSVRFKGAGFEVLSWDQPREQLLNGLQGASVLINLSGAGIADQKWSPERKQQLETSRLNPIIKLAGLLEEGQIRLQLVMQASAIGYYGAHESRQFDESSPAGTGLLAELTQKWEDQADIFKSYTQRLILLRTGVVLSPDGGALKAMMMPFRFFAGGKIGSGKQWVSWIDIEDQVEAMLYLMRSPESEGVYNLVAPNPVSQASLAKAIGKAMKRPAMLPVPAFALKMMLGEMAVETVLTGAYVQPTRLLEGGFVFHSEHVDQALNQLIDQ